MVTKPDPKDFMLSNLTEQEIIREPGTINGLDFVIDNLQKCSVYLLNHLAQITIDDCVDCNFFFGPCEGSIFIRDCSNCNVSVSSGQFRTKNCHNMDFCIYSASDPSIEYSDGLRFAPLNLSYPGQDVHFTKANLDGHNNFWSQVFDFNLTADQQHWALLPPDEFRLVEKAFEGKSEPVNPVATPQEYGGTLPGPIAIGSQQQPGAVGGIQSFGLEVSQEAAETQITNTVGAGDPFTAQPSDVFADQSSDPFGAQPSDPFGAEPISSGDPFAAPESTDPFGSADTEQPIQVEGSFASDMDEEEIERQRQRDVENQARMQSLYEREEEERVQKEQRRDEATNQLQAWLEQRMKTIETRKKVNFDQESVFRERKGAGTGETSWQRVVSMVDFKAQTETIERDRLRSVLIAKKNEG